MAKWIGGEDLLTGPRFVTNRDRLVRGTELTTIFDEVFATRDRSEWRTILDANGIVFEVVAPAQDIPTDVQLIANDILISFDGDTALTVTVRSLSKVRIKLNIDARRRWAKHTDEVLREAGYDEESIKNFGKMARSPRHLCPPPSPSHIFRLFGDK